MQHWVHDKAYARVGGEMFRLDCGILGYANLILDQTKPEHKLGGIERWHLSVNGVEIATILGAPRWATASKILQDVLTSQARDITFGGRFTDGYRRLLAYRQLKESF